MPGREPVQDEGRDEVLVERIRQGDDAALTTLYRRHVEAIYRFVLAQVRDPADAEDLTSETFARMLRGLVGFRGEASFRNWLYQIARNAVRNHRRSAAYRRVVPLSGAMVADEPTPPEPPDSPQRSQAVLDLLSKLPPRYRRVLELRFLEGRTIEQTAADLAVTVSNAKVLQHRALRKAAHIMEEGRIEVRTGPS